MDIEDHFGDDATCLVRASSRRTDGPLSRRWHEVSFYKLVDRRYGIAVDVQRANGQVFAFKHDLLDGEELLKYTRTLDLDSVSVVADPVNAADTEEVARAFRACIDRVREDWRSTITMVIEQPVVFLGYAPSNDLYLVNDGMLVDAILSDGGRLKPGEVCEEAVPLKIRIRTKDGPPMMLAHARIAEKGTPAFDEIKPQRSEVDLAEDECRRVRWSLEGLP